MEKAKSHLHVGPHYTILSIPHYFRQQMWLSRLEAMALHSIRHGRTSRAQAGVQFYPHHARDVAGAPRLRRARLVVVSVFDSTVGRGGMVSWARADGGRRGRAHGGRGRA